MNPDRRRLPLRIAGVAAALVAAGLAAELPTTVYCNLRYLRSIEVDGGVVLRSVLAPTALLQFAAGWLLLFVSAFLLGARPSASARPRWPSSPWSSAADAAASWRLRAELMSAPHRPPARWIAARGCPRMQAHATIEASPQGAEPAYTAHINALGLRGPERDPARPAILIGRGLFRSRLSRRG
ncbi:MAG: hypothetical protein R3F39_08350 [Myxococcota bacterium]